MSKWIQFSGFEDETSGFSGFETSGFSGFETSGFSGFEDTNTHQSFKKVNTPMSRITNSLWLLKEFVNR